MVNFKIQRFKMKKLQHFMEERKWKLELLHPGCDQTLLVLTLWLCSSVFGKAEGSWPTDSLVRGVHAANAGLCHVTICSFLSHFIADSEPLIMRPATSAWQAQAPINIPLSHAGALAALQCWTESSGFRMRTSLIFTHKIRMQSKKTNTLKMCLPLCIYMIIRQQELSSAFKLPGYCIIRFTHLLNPPQGTW